MTEELEQGMALPMVFDVPEDVITRRVTNIVVQHTEDEFLLSFYEVVPPILLGSPKEVKAKLSELKEIRARCVARLAVSPSRMEQFVEVFKGNLATYQKTHREKGDGCADQE